MPQKTPGQLRRMMERRSTGVWRRVIMPLRMLSRGSRALVMSWVMPMCSLTMRVTPGLAV